MVETAAFDDARGWRASLSLGFRADGDRTVLAHRQRHGPLAVQRPFYPEGGVCHVYLLHPPGGVVGGDRLEIDLECGRDTQALLTTPGATKFYRSSVDSASQHQRLRVAEGASLEWMPQENILFPGADVRLDTRVDLTADARLALWEIHCLGRPSNDERFDTGRIDGRLSVYRDGVPLLLERLRFSGQGPRRRSHLAGHPVVGTFLIGPAGAAERAAARDGLPDPGEDQTGVTLIDDLLVVRYLGSSTERARRLFVSIWSTLRETTLGRPPSAPRIWAT
jgi:urease accessory protein